MKKLTQKDAFDLMLWAMISDCGTGKKYLEFKRALAKASDILHGTAKLKPRKEKK